ncbi:MAG: TetR/AcrR family transcriptional regulator [Lachnospiraceae bacterium]|nr:TetR/AcrR family transcriptional regulator [Lachnospiraceae bacterium]
MDIRIKKTKESITNAFLELRSRKPLEKITVKELCEKAMINKSTFYSHYTDVYDLSEQLENEVVEAVLSNLSEQSGSQSSDYVTELFHALLSYDHLIKILFSGDRQGRLLTVLKPQLQKLFLPLYQEHSNSPEKAAILLNFCINGCYCAFMENRSYGDEFVIQVLSEINDTIVSML